MALPIPRRFASIAGLLVVVSLLVTSASADMVPIQVHTQEEEPQPAADEAAVADDVPVPDETLQADDAEPAAEPAGTCRITVQEWSARCLDDRGTERWHFAPPAWWADPVDLTAEDRAPRGWEARLTAGPDGFEDHVAFGSALLVLDLDNGRVERRVPFPAPIVGLEASGPGTLAVELGVPGWSMNRSDEYVSTTVAWRRGGPPPAQDAWVASAAFGPWIEAMALVHAHHDAAEEELVRILEEAGRQDPTNPFLHLHRGRILAELGRDAAAAEAFSQAVETEGATLHSLMQLATQLEIDGQDELAQRAFGRGLTALNQEALSTERMVLSTHPNLLLGLALDGVHDFRRDIFNELDLDTIDRVHGRVTQLFPYLELGPESWRLLARWMEEQGDSDRAEDWRFRAQVADDAPYNQLMSGTPTRIILTSTLGLALGLAGLFLFFLLGLGRAGGTGAADSSEQTPAGRPGGSSAGTAFIAILLLIAAAGLTVESQVRSHHVALTALAPPAVYGDTLAHPSVQLWLDELHTSPSRDRLLDIVRSEASAVAEGEPIETRPRVEADVVDATHRTALAQTFAPPRTEGDWLPTPMALGWVSLSPLMLLLMLGFGSALAVGAGWAARRAPPSAARWIRFAIPGALARSAVLSAVMLCLFMAALCWPLALGQLNELVEGQPLSLAAGLSHVDAIRALAPPPERLPWTPLVFLAGLAALALHALQARKALRDG